MLPLIIKITWIRSVHEKRGYGWSNLEKGVKNGKKVEFVVCLKFVFILHFVRALKFSIPNSVFGKGRGGTFINLTTGDSCQLFHLL